MTHPNLPAKHAFNPQVQSSALDSKPPIRLLLGGSFDPVHNSHINMLWSTFEQLCFEQDCTPSSDCIAEFLPTARSPFKTNTTAIEHRLAMLALACDSLNVKINAKTLAFNDNIAYPFGINVIELQKPPPSYTIDTLIELRAQHPNSCLIFVMGADSLAGLSKWRLGEQLTDYAHLWVVPRDDMQTPELIAQMLPDILSHKVTEHIDDLKFGLCGRIYISSRQVLPLSSSAIRHAFNDGDFESAKAALPEPVYHYICQHHLYQANEAD